MRNICEYFHWKHLGRGAINQVKKLGPSFKYVRKILPIFDHPLTSVYFENLQENINSSVRIYQNLSLSIFRSRKVGGQWHCDYTI